MNGQTKKGERSKLNTNNRILFNNTNWKKNKNDFHWIKTNEPHSVRRRKILEEHPEITQLFGTDITTFYYILFIIISQLWISSWIGNTSWLTYSLILYCYGATVNHALFLLNHEATHNLIFENGTANLITQILINIPMGVPTAIRWRYYHIDHHVYQGVNGMDTLIPTDWELKTFRESKMKFIWVFFQPLVHNLRRQYINSKDYDNRKWSKANIVCIVISDLLILWFFGINALFYLVFSTLFSSGLHPFSGHIIAEHYEFVKGYETYSYYGILNYFNFNVGYHNEHHDFPKVPWSKLPMVTKIAPEWYYNMPYHDSYCKVIWNYITDPEMGPWSRIKRQTRSTFNKHRKM